MISVTEAQTLVLEHVTMLPAEMLPLESPVLGLVLAEDVSSDLDMPPYDKSLMDGYAVRFADLPDGQATLDVIEEITAGKVPTRELGPGQAARIMTGAPLPDGADSVVMVERSRLIAEDRVAIEDSRLKAGQNILRQATEMRRGDRILPAGTLLRPQEVGLLAAVGRTAVKIVTAPTVAILATGDELVDSSKVPAPGQIRNSNGPMLVAQTCRAGGIPRNLGIAPDRLDVLRSRVEEGLKSAVLILSGGVSAGKLDLVPGVLQDLGVQAHFHKVAMKPGKPVFFGTRGTTLVFGLPGNPVSTLVCFELFVRPALRKLRGIADVALAPQTVSARLTEDFSHRSDRPTYYPACLEESTDGRSVRPVPWFGSADLRALAQANAFLCIPIGEHRYQAGEKLTVLKVED